MTDDVGEVWNEDRYRLIEAKFVTWGAARVRRRATCQKVALGRIMHGDEPPAPRRCRLYLS